jgi:phenylacetate-CoA ligase
MQERPEHRAMLQRLREHPAAPRWNHRAGDRLQPADLEALDALRATLRSERRGLCAQPSPEILARVERWGVTVPRLRRLAVRPRDWSSVPTMSREDVALQLDSLVPDDADLERLLVYRTAGVTGHALLVPHDPLAVAAYIPLLEVALAAHGVDWQVDGETVAAFLVGAQARTVTYPTALSAWAGAGFAKLNLQAGEWPHGPHRYFQDLQPRLLTGDPLSFAEVLRLDLQVQPRALVSTAVAMSEGLRRRLQQRFGVPVIDWYSLTEVGPIGYRCPQSDAYHVVPHDLFVEVLAAPGERGEIAVTGGRNPFLPLVRYRTGDYGRMDYHPCPCGDPMPRLVELEGRVPVVFRSADGRPVGTVDLSRLLRELPVVQHTFHQGHDGACTLVVRPLPGARLDVEQVRDSLASLLGAVPLTVTVDPDLGTRHGKVVPYSSDLLLED